MNVNLPEGLFRSIKWALQFHVPILITENGIEDDRDDSGTLHGWSYPPGLAGGHFNWPVRGYFWWSL